MNFRFLKNSSIHINEFECLITNLLVMNFLAQTSIIKLPFKRGNHSVSAIIVCIFIEMLLSANIASNGKWSFCIYNCMSAFLYKFHQNTQQVGPSMKILNCFLSWSAFFKRWGKFGSEIKKLAIHSIKIYNHKEIFLIIREKAGISKILVSSVTLTLLCA